MASPRSTMTSSESDDADQQSAWEVDEGEVAMEVKDVIAHLQLPIVSFSLATRAALEPFSSSTAITALLFLDPLTQSSSAPPTPPSINVSGRTVDFLFQSYDLPRLTALPPLAPRPPLSASDAARFRSVANVALLHFRRGRSNVIAVTAGYASRSDGTWSDAPHWLIFVHHKGFVPLGEAVLPKLFKQLPVSVHEGRYEALPTVTTTRRRRFDTVKPSGVFRYVEPLQPGVSIGIVGVEGGGTLGGFLVEEKGPEEGAIFGLTSAHVLRSRTRQQGESEYDVRRITQPAPSDDLRSKVAALEFQQSQLLIHIRPGRSRTPEQAAQLTQINRQLHQISSAQHRTSDDDVAATVIGEVDPELCVLDEHCMHVMVDDVRHRAAIGIDAAVFQYTGDRLITPSFTSSDLEERKLSLTSDVLEWTYEANESEDVVIKMGRTTGYTLGTPISTPSAVNTRQVGTFSIVRPGSRCDVADYQRQSDSIWLCNQYLVAHHAGEPFADVGDSGTVGYLNSRTWDPSSGWKLRPWGLLHARVLSHSYSFDVLSPIDAVLQCFKDRTFRFLAPDNAHLLGDRKSDE